MQRNETRNHNKSLAVDTGSPMNAEMTIRAQSLQIIRSIIASVTVTMMNDKSSLVVQATRFALQIANPLDGGHKAFKRVIMLTGNSAIDNRSAVSGTESSFT
jgi:hypothetical protein